MKENLVIVNCKVSSEAYEMMTLLRQEPKARGCKVSHAAIVKKEAGKLSLADGFVADGAEGDGGWTGGLLGGVVGLLAGPVGALVGGGVGALLGNSMDKEARKGAAKVLEKAGERLADGDTALVLLAMEKDESALDEALKAFQVTVTRLDAKEVAAEIEAAEKRKGRKNSAAAPGSRPEDGETQTLVLGNFITVDPKRPTAKAVVVKNGVFAYIGDAETAKKLAGPEAKVLDYGENYIYPGFLESHCHSYLAGDRAIGQANLAQVGLTDYAKYREIIREFIQKNPQRAFYMAAGWVENDEYVTKAYLDEICADKILLMQTGGGHSMLLNSKALEWAGIDAAYAKKMGYDLVHVDENGQPDGYICEAPVFALYPKLPTTLENAKDYLLAWQDMALANGYTAVADAGVEVTNPIAVKAFYELEQEGKLKLRTYAYLMCPDNPEDPKAEVARIAADRAKYSGEYFHVIGVKTFLDGVTEAHTAWQNQDYLDQPGYHGNERFNDHDKMVELITAADAEGLSVHVHSEGGGATHFMLGCIEDAEKITGDLDQRNVLAHLHFVTDEDIRRMAATGSVPAVPPLWTAAIPGFYEIEVSYVGKELAEHSYPIKSFFDAGAYPVFHSDYPVSPSFSIPHSIYMAETRALPKSFGIETETQHNIKEAITREQSLRALTINVAYAWHQEHRLGSIEFGKLANMTVYDCDFLHDDIEKVAGARIVATLVDGEEVYKA